jgi:putative membrane protein
MWTAAAGVPMAAAQGSGSGGGSAQGGSQAGSSTGATAGAGSIGDSDAQAGTATTTGTQASKGNDVQQFIEKAATANMAEIELGQLAQQQAQDPQVKQFAQMMVDEHTKALDQLKTAAGGQGTIPSALDSKHQKLHDKLAKLQGAEFDRAYMAAMVDGHKDAEKLLKSRAGSHGSESASNMSGGASGAAGATGTSGTSGSGTSATSGTGGSTSASTESATSSVGTPGTTASLSAADSSAAPTSPDQWAAMTLPKVRAHLEQARSLDEQVKRAGKSNNGGNNGAGSGAGASGGSTGSGSTGSTPPQR